MAKKNNEIFKHQSSLRSENNIYYCFYEHVKSFLITTKVGKKKNGKELRHVGKHVGKQNDNAKLLKITYTTQIANDTISSPQLSMQCRQTGSIRSIMFQIMDLRSIMIHNIYRGQEDG